MTLAVYAAAEKSPVRSTRRPLASAAQARRASAANADHLPRGLAAGGQDELDEARRVLRIGGIER